MKKILLVLVAVLLTAIIQSPAAEPLRVFIRAGAKTHGPNQHDHPRFLREWTQLLNERGMKTEGGMDFPTAEQLAKTDVVIIHAQDGMKIVGEDRTAFEKFLARGGGVVVIHAGVVGGDQHEWIKQTIGGAWRWPSPQLPRDKATKWLEGEVGVFWVDTDHPISRNMSNFDWTDEIYYDMDLASDIGVLATSFHNVHIIAPQIWTYERTIPGANTPYHAFVSLPGHEYSSFNTPQYRTVLLRGIAWAGKRANVDEFCKPDELASLRYPPGGPRSAQDAMKTLTVHPEFNVSLAADENVAEKIMSLDWDPQGRLWVVETPEYPGGRDINRNDAKISPWRNRDPDSFPVGGKEPRPATDKISMLEDTNGDGVMNKKTVFFEGLELPTSLVFYKDGVIVSQAPDTYWIRDTDGDGKADKKETLFTGWGTFDAHAVTSNLRWGPDGWVYGSVGYSAGNVTSADGSKKFGQISAGIYRFRPDGSALEQVAAGSCNTWGCEVAPDGEIFFSTATCGEPMLHVVLPEKIISRAGLSGVRAAKPIIEENKVYPPRHETRQPYIQIDWVGAFTAAAGATIYDGGAWPGKWQGPPWAFFVSEPTVWLMHQEFVGQDGVSYQGHKEAGREQQHFLTSTDYWFKPIHARVGPDGALYVVDFYNQIAVHNDTRGPAHGARNAATRPDRNHHFTRLYRVQHKQAQALPAYKLDRKNPSQLVAMLDHPNGWVRGTANRLLSEGAGTSEVPALEAKAANASTAYGRMEALWVLHNLNALKPGLIAAAAQDPSPVVRKNAMRIASEQDNSNVEPSPELVRALLADSDQRVRIAALVAGTTLTPNRELATALVAAWPTFQEPHLQAAALAITANDPVLFLSAALDANNAGALAGLVSQLARQVAEQNDAETAGNLVVALAGKPASVDTLKVAALQSLTANLKSALKPSASTPLGNALKQLLASDQTATAVLPFIARWDYSSQVGDAAKAAVTKAEARLANKSGSDEERGQIAANLLGVRTLDASIVPAVAAIVGSDTSADLQRRVIAALGTTSDAAAGQALLTALPKLSLDLREAAFGELLKRSDWSAAVVQALADRKLDPTVLGPSNLHRLRTHPDAAVAERAVKALDALRGPETREKEALIAKLRPEVIKPGNAVNGAKIFTANCAQCHQFKNEGALFAPNLTGMGAHGPEDLLVHILDPNRIVEPNYFSVSIDTKDDLSYDGIVLRENRNVVVLRNQTAETEIRKDNIVSRRGSTRSLMPEGFEQLGTEGLRDLLTFLCADEQRFRILDLSAAFTADTSRGLYLTPEDKTDSLRFRKWGTIKHKDVPFDIVNPARTANGKNVIVLQGGSGFAQSYPREVEVKVGLPVTRLHFLGGVAGWGYPATEQVKPAVKVTVHFAGGEREELVLSNGVEIADHVGRIEVPGSVEVENLGQLLPAGRQVRYFAKPLTKRGVVEKLTLASYNNETAPTFVGITAEVGDGAPASGPARSAGASQPFRAMTNQPPAFIWTAPLKVLIIGGGASHDYEQWFNVADKKILNAIPGVSANYTDTTGGLADEIKHVDVLIVSNNKPFTDDATRAAIAKHIENGKGFIGLHPGLWYNWKDWPEYNRVLVGGGSRGHDRLGEFEVVVTDPSYPLMKGVPAKFNIKDELYWFEPDARGTPIKVLATAHSPSKNKDFPQVFTVEHPKARVVGITLGHDGDAHNLPAYIQLLRNAVLWTAGKDTK
ncbi:MAG TPA: PVC-type heme-binding CxxCH protein [Verrucomicrobiae bacterium]|nr:PVC-type heme-binding CxxCH protein [Verrucomicrobiae bacterium]